MKTINHLKQLCIAFLALMTPLPILQAKGLEIGAPAPALTATNQEGETIDLGSAFAQGLTLVYFYPKADTPGCTAQSCSLRDNYDALVGEGIKVFGVSYDSPESQKKFKTKYDLPFPLIADQDKQVSKAFNRGFFARQAYLIKDGVVVWRDLKASTGGQAADIKAAIKELGL